MDENVSKAAVLVSGGASGIGRRSALLLAESGWPVVVGDRDEELLATLAEEAGRAGLPLRTQHLELTEPETIRAFVASAVETEGQLWGLVCAAGVAPDQPFLELTEELWRRVIEINLTGLFITAQEVARVLVGQANGGSIVTVASTAGVIGAPNLAHYSASKGGVVALTKTMALELGKHQVRVNCVAPGATDTALFRSRVSEEYVRSWSKSPLGRIGLPEDHAHCVEYLMSDRSSWITGQTFHVNGGSYMA